MSTEHLSLIISGVIAITSLLIPLIQTLVNRKLDERKLTIQHLYSDKLKIFEELMDSFGKYVRHPANIDSFLSCLCKAMLYCDDSIKERLHNIIELASKESQYRNACQQFKDLIPYFSFEIANSRKKLVINDRKTTNENEKKSTKLSNKNPKKSD
jgi:hypothetical protein